MVPAHFYQSSMHWALRILPRFGMRASEQRGNFRPGAENCRATATGYAI